MLLRCSVIQQVHWKSHEGNDYGVVLAAESSTGFIVSANGFISLGRCCTYISLSGRGSMMPCHFFDLLLCSSQVPVNFDYSLVAAGEQRSKKATQNLSQFKV